MTCNQKPQSFWKAKLCATCVVLAVMLCSILAWAACGGGGKPGTPKGTYTLTIKAVVPASAGMTSNLSHSTTVTLTVD